MGAYNRISPSCATPASGGSGGETASIHASRTVSADHMGMLTHQELLQAQGNGRRRRTLEELIAKEQGGQAVICADKVKAAAAKARSKTAWFVDHASLRLSYDDVMMVITTFVLFGDDLRIIFCPPSADGAFMFLLTLSFFLFILEMILHCWAKTDYSNGILNAKGYAFSFFFWLDLLAVVSMVPDLPWLSGGPVGSLLDQLGTRAGKAGRIGARSSRVVRMIRLVRLVKLYKVTSNRAKEKQQFEDLRKLMESGHFSHDEVQEFLDKSNEKKQSKVGAELSDIITRRVIVVVLLMLIVVPLLTISSQVDNELEAVLSLNSVNVYAGEDSCEYLSSSVANFKSFMDGLGGPEDPFLVALEVSPPRVQCDHSTPLNFADNSVISSVRDEALRVIFVEDRDYSIKATFNLTHYIHQESVSSVQLMVFILVMLVVLSAQFTGDAQRLVLAPIENMMNLIDHVAKDPLEDFDDYKNVDSGNYETNIVQTAIARITHLLRVGFGVAGAEIISSNMTVEGGGNTSLNPMLPGKRVYALFGFADIQSFDLCQERLGDEIMTFVNSVARIVHNEVTRWGGTCNKNLGQAFLLVWRIGDENALSEYRSIARRRDSERSNPGDGNGCRTTDSTRPKSRSSKTRQGLLARNGEIDLRKIPGLDMLSDKALVGFLKVVVELNRDVQLLTYRSDERLASGSNGGGFQIRMGFGLHAGWAIEGAVGSLQKVDATYLSPHVNMAARAQAATRQFQVSLLMTRSFFKLLSDPAQQTCRKIDVVTVKGSNVPMPVYTYDTFQNQVFPVLRTPKYSSLSLHEVLDSAAENYDASVWTSDPDLTQLRCLATRQFTTTFAQGLENYIGGRWEEARLFLHKADRMMASNDIGGDGPSRTLLAYMGSLDFRCPPDWDGHRPLTSK